jgi:hypothetical protein
MSLPAICFISNNKMNAYCDKLQEIDNKNLFDFALYTPINALLDFCAKYELYKLILDIPGAILEMGVCSGNGLMTLVHCHNILEQTYSYREFYGFDTFEGFPSIHENDVCSSNNIKKGDYKNECFDRLNHIFKVHNDYYYLPTKVKLIKGDVKDTIPRFIDENKHIIIALLYLDLDLYEPTKTSLKHFISRMAKGSVIAFDELNYKMFPGETIAVIEELGLKYKFKKLLNSHINYCIIE